MKIEPQLAADSPPADAPPANWGSPANLMVVLLFVLFFQGCESKGVALTVGPIAPFLQVIYEEDSLLTSHVVYVSVLRAVLNVSVLMLVFVVAPRVWPRWNRLARSRRFQAAAVTTAALFNLVLIAESLWIDLVFLPIAWTCDRLNEVVDIRKDWHAFTLAAISRAYFVTCWAGVYGVTCLVLLVGERYLGFDRRRWWQFNLRMLMALTFVVGTTLGILLRIMPK